MNKLYNTFEDISTNFSDVLHSLCPFLPKTALNILPDILTSMISSTSCVTKNIASSLKGLKFDYIHDESKERRIRRFFNNSNYDPYRIYDSLIKHVFQKFSCKHGDNRIYIVFDHMFEREQFVTFMLSLRIGQKSIPLWFRSFKGGHKSTEAFKIEVLKEGIKYVSDLFICKPNYNLVFLADRWFGFPALLSYIDSLGHSYVVRIKSDVNVFYHDDKEGHLIKKKSGDLFHYTHKPTYFEFVHITEEKFKTNIVISATKSVSIKEKTDSGKVDEAWIIATNSDVKRAIKWYGYRFSSIEFLFKDQKSNGFNLEKTATRNLQAFSMMYTCVNICILYLVCISTYYTRHKGKFYSDVKIRYFSVVNGKNKRRYSLFQVGLMLFKRAFGSTKYIKLPFNFVLTDV